MKSSKSKFIGSLFILSSMLVSKAAVAEISGNVSIGSDYVYRGISQTGENPTIQGGFDFEDESGFYAGIWSSNVSFDGSIEIDLYAGFSNSINENVDYDIGFLRYEYPDDEQGGAAASSFNEIYGSVSFSNFTFGLAYSPDFFAESDKATYLYVDYELGLPNDFGLAFHYGKQSIDDNAAFGTPDYADYSIGLSKTVAAVDLSLTWFDSDLSTSECFGGGDDCDSRIVLAIGKSL